MPRRSDSHRDRRPCAGSVHTRTWVLAVFAAAVLLLGACAQVKDPTENLGNDVDNMFTDIGDQLGGG